MNEQPTVRRARVYAPSRTVEAYLPANYKVVGFGSDEEGRTYTTIEGTDLAGWTLDGYVIPRLASGLYACREVEQP